MFADVFLTFVRVRKGLTLFGQPLFTAPPRDIINNQTSGLFYCFVAYVNHMAMKAFHNGVCESLVPSESDHDWRSLHWL